MNCILPIPPSANALFIAVGRRRVKSKPYTAWIAQAGLMLNLSGMKPVSAPVRVSIRVGRCNRARDLDNAIKPTVDLLVRHGIIPDDNMMTVVSVSAEMAFGDVPDGMIEVTLT